MRSPVVLDVPLGGAAAGDGWDLRGATTAGPGCVPAWTGLAVSSSRDSRVSRSGRRWRSVARWVFRVHPMDTTSLDGRHAIGSWPPRVSIGNAPLPWRDLRGQVAPVGSRRQGPLTGPGRSER